MDYGKTSGMSALDFGCYCMPINCLGESQRALIYENSSSMVAIQMVPNKIRHCGLASRFIDPGQNTFKGPTRGMGSMEKISYGSL